MFNGAADSIVNEVVQKFDLLIEFNEQINCDHNKMHLSNEIVDIDGQPVAHQDCSWTDNKTCADYIEMQPKVDCNTNNNNLLIDNTASDEVLNITGHSEHITKILKPPEHQDCDIPLSTEPNSWNNSDVVDATLEDNDNRLTINDIAPVSDTNESLPEINDMVNKKGVIDSVFFACDVDQIGTVLASDVISFVKSTIGVSVFLYKI